MYYNKIFVVDGPSSLSLRDLLVKTIPDEYPLVSKERTLSHGKYVAKLDFC